MDIDAVVTWVDGADEKFVTSISNAIQDKSNRGLQYLPHGRGHQRFADSNEIEYCIRGIRKFAPWIRRVFLVTAGQIPEFLGEQARRALDITLVDHTTIFRGYEDSLPTFNSVSIGSMLHRIPGVAGHYIYFNDDVIPIRPFHPTDFFTGGKVILRGRWERTSILPYISPTLLGLCLRFLGLLETKPRSTHLLPQMRAAAIAGFTQRFFHLEHAPHPIRTETLESFFAKNDRLIRNNIRHKFRSLEQFTASALAHHLEARSGSYIALAQSDTLTLDFSKESAAKLIRQIHSPEVKFLCLQDFERAPECARNEITSWLLHNLRQRKETRKYDDTGNHWQ